MTKNLKKKFKLNKIKNKTKDKLKIIRVKKLRKIFY